MRKSGAIILHAGLAVLLGTGVAAGLETREIIASGDLVPGVGRIGLFGVDLRGIDARGRTLIEGRVSDGRVGLYWADGEGIAPAWETGQPAAAPVTLLPFRASVGADGRIAVLGELAPPPTWYNRRDALYVIEPDGVSRLFSRDDRGSEGELICGLSLFEPERFVRAINVAGAVAFQASTVDAGLDCSYGDDDGKFVESIYRIESGAARRLVSFGDQTPEGLTLNRITMLGLADDGAVVLMGGDLYWSEGVILRAGDEGVRTLVAPGQPGAAGGTLSEITGLTANAAGEVLFVASETGARGLYRTDGGQLVRLDAAFTLADGQAFYVEPAPASMNARGDAVASIDWQDADGSYRSGLMLYPAAGGRILIEDGHSGLVNDRGDLVYVDEGDRIVRRRGGNVERLVGTLDAAPGGGVFAVQGLTNSNCLGDDGLVAALAYSDSDQAALACIDADGISPVARPGDPAPNGGRFFAVAGCARASADEILFTAYSTEAGFGDFGLYRATPAGIETVLIADEQVSLNQFLVNRRGTVALPDSSGLGPHVRLVRRDGSARTVTFDAGFPSGGTVRRVRELGLADDDTLVAIVQVRADPWHGEHAVVEATADGARILAMVDDPSPDEDNGWEPQFDALSVAGDLYAFRVRDGDSWPYSGPTVVGRVGSDDPPVPLLPGSDAIILGLTPGGRAFVDGRAFLYEEGSLIPLPANENNNLPPGVPVALNDRGNILFHSYQVASGGYREALHLSGEPPEAHCFVPPTSLPQSLATRTPTATGTRAVPTGTPSCSGPNCEAVAIEVGSVVARRGETVSLDVRLRDGGWAVAGIQVDVAFPPEARIAAGANGRPACAVDPAIDKPATSFSFQPPGCAYPDECRAARAIVLSFSDVAPIPDGAVLFRCDVAIDAAAAAGTHALRATEVGASTPEGMALPVRGIDGGVTITAEPTRNSASRPGTSSSGCQVGDPAAPLAAWPFVAVILAPLLRILGRANLGEPRGQRATRLGKPRPPG